MVDLSAAEDTDINIKHLMPEPGDVLTRILFTCRNGAPESLARRVCIYDKVNF